MDVEFYGLWMFMVDISINNMKNNYSYVKIRMFSNGLFEKNNIHITEGLAGHHPAGTPFWTSPGMGDLSLNMSCDLGGFNHWIGFLGKILTGNHGFLPSNLSGFPVNFPIIQFYDSNMNF